MEAELPPALLGDRLELIEEIGQGGMGTVWSARHLRLGRQVAVKFLAKALVDKPTFAKRFEREARVLARLDHPGIVAIHDFGTEEGRPYIVMEYVNGRPLSECLPLPSERARGVCLEVLDALAYAHGQGVVHRDIKPHNVLIEASGRAKVSDFGIARLLDSGSAPDITTEGRVLGTPAYMAPEALAGAPPDPRMDVFAAGVLLHEAITGRRPPEGQEMLPPALGPVVSRATARDPMERYLSAALMREHLAAVDLASEGSGDGRLPPEEQHWLRAVALVQTLATAAVLWALLQSVTPRLVTPGEVQPLIMLQVERLADGRLVSHARFETWPTLMAIATVIVALLAQGLLRRHWRAAGLDAPRPHRPVPAAPWVLGWGLLAVSLYEIRGLTATPGAFWTAYVPIAGGLLELVVLFAAWTAILEAWRCGRPLGREAPLWLGLGLALVPPIEDLFRYLRDWRP